MMAEDTPAAGGDENQTSLPQNQVDIEDAGTLKKKVTVTIPEKTITTKRDEMFGELSASAQIPGFRIGRAPRRLIEKRFGSEISEDVRNALVGEALGDALDKTDLKPLGEPDVKLEEIELPESGEMSFSFEVEVQPEFDLPETEGIEVTKEVFEATDERLDEYLQNVAEGQARYEKADDPAEEGDGVVASAKITGEGVEQDVPRVTLRVAPGVIEGIAIVELADKLKGVKPGDTVTLETEVNESHPNEQWQGKTLTIELTIHEVNRRILPEINDEFAEQRGFDSLDEFRTFLAERLEARADQEVQQSMRQQIIDHLLENTEFDLPEGVVQRHTARMLQRQYIELLQSGVPREKIDENLARLQAAAGERAVRDLKSSFILSKVAEANDIEVGDDEINSRIAQIATMNGRRPERVRQELAADGTLEQVGVAIREEKALDKLLEQAKVTEKPAEDDSDEDEKQPAQNKATKKASKKTAKKSDTKKPKDASSTSKEKDEDDG
jgi:trigger factor